MAPSFNDCAGESGRTARNGMTDKTSKSSLAAIDALRRHPQFQPAMRADASTMVALYRGNRVLNALMSDRARALFSHGALFLHYSGADDAGLTVGAMKDFCAMRGAEPAGIRLICRAQMSRQTTSLLCR